jgi:hypothetical protein
MQAGRPREQVRIEGEATVYYWLDPEHIAVPVGSFADPTFPAPRVSVWEDRMHPWVGLPDRIEHIG